MRQCVVWFVVMLAACVDSPPPLAVEAQSRAALQDGGGRLTVHVTEEGETGSPRSHILRGARDGQHPLAKTQANLPAAERAPVQALPSMRSITRGLSTSTHRIAVNPALAVRREGQGNLAATGAQERALRVGSDAERALAGGLLEFTKRIAGTTMTIVFDPKADQMVSVVTEDASGHRLERDLRPAVPGIVERMRVTNGIGSTRIIEVRTEGGAP